MSQPKAIYLKDYSEPNFKIDSVNLTFELEDEHTTVTNIMEITKVNSEATHLELDSIELELKNIFIDEVETKDYTYENEILTIHNVAQNFTLKIQNIIYPADNTELEGLYLSGGIYCTQNEPEGYNPSNSVLSAG